MVLLLDWRCAFQERTSLVRLHSSLCSMKYSTCTARCTTISADSVLPAHRRQRAHRAGHVVVARVHVEDGRVQGHQLLDQLDSQRHVELLSAWPGGTSAQLPSVSCSLLLWSSAPAPSCTASQLLQACTQTVDNGCSRAPHQMRVEAVPKCLALL